MKAVRSRSSRSLAHKAADGRVHERATDSLKSKRRPCGRLPSSWNCSVVVGMLVFRGAVVRGPASVVRLFCRVWCCVLCERPCAGLPARCPRCTRVNGTHPSGHGLLRLVIRLSGSRRTARGFVPDSSLSILAFESGRFEIASLPAALLVHSRNSCLQCSF